MNEKPKFYPLGLLIVGALGLLLIRPLVVFDGGLSAPPPDSAYQTESGDDLYTFKEIHMFVVRYSQARAGLWALDVLAVYMLGHGLVSTLIHHRELKLWFVTGRNLRGFSMRITLGILLGAAFWFAMTSVNWVLAMPLH